MALNLTNFDAALKVHYTADRIENLTYPTNPLFAMLSKTQDFGGRNLPVPIIFGNPQGRSASFTNAQNNVTNTQITDFILTRVTDYGLATIDGEVIEASQGDNNAFMRAVATEIDGTLASLARSASIAMYGSGSGTIGQLSATSGVTTVITLADINEITNFEVGMTLQLSTADGGGTVKTGTTAITDIDRDLGTVTVATSLATFTPIGAVNDFIFVQGDYDAKMSGLAAWLPTTAPSATLFFGVDRTSDVTRLGGIRIAGAGAPIEEVIIDATKRVGREGGRPDKLFLSYERWGELDKSLGSKVQYVDLTVDGRVGFTGIRVNGPNGPIDVVPDTNCPDPRGYLLQMSMWKFYGLGRIPRIFREDGLTVLRQSTADGVEVRALYRGQMGCRAPGFNAVITW